MNLTLSLLPTTRCEKSSGDLRVGIGVRVEYELVWRLHGEHGGDEIQTRREKICRVESRIDDGQPPRSE